MYRKLTKAEILYAIEEKGISMEYLNSLIGGYEGKLDDWKNGKILLNSGEFAIIKDYILGVDAPPITDEDIKYALFDGTEGITDEMYEEVRLFALEVKQRERAKRMAQQ